MQAITLIQKQALGKIEKGRSSTTDASWETKSRIEKAAHLETLFSYEETEVAFGTTESEVNKREDSFICK